MATKTKTCDPLSLGLRPGNLIILRGGKAKIVTRLTPARIMKLLKQGISANILSMSMTWDDVMHDTCGFIVSKIKSRRCDFEMYFALINGRMVTIYGFHDGIEVIDRIGDVHLAD